MTPPANLQDDTIFDGSSPSLAEDYDSEIPPSRPMYGDNPIGIRDAVHGVITLPELCRKIIDTEEFQRLRYFKQCGPCFHVFPTAIHTRFDHSIGVCHLAGKLVMQLNDFRQREHKELISPVEKLCIQIAGLCHDLGHGPFSHTWERFIHKAGYKDYKHENMAADIFKHLVINNNLTEEFMKYEISEKRREFICDLIQGKLPSHMFESKQFLAMIIANKSTGIDVDKWDYMMRDSFFMGISNEVAVDRLIDGVGIMEVDNTTHIAFRDKLNIAIAELFQFRAKMHMKGYQHPTCKVIETMYLDLLMHANENGYTVEKSALSESHLNLKAFLKLTDDIFMNIANDPRPEFSKAKNIMRRIHTRNLYPVVFRSKIDKKIDLQDLEEKIQSKFKIFKYFATEIKLDFGDDISDPLSNVKFFTKDKELRKITFSDLPPFYGNDVKFSYKELLVLCNADKNNFEGTKNEEIEEVKSFIKLYIN